MLSDRAECMEKMMKQTLIRYKTKPEMGDRNAELIAGGVRGTGGREARKAFAIFRCGSRTTRFVHIVETETDDGSSALPRLAAFKAFQNGIRERCAEPPVARGVTIVGNYRMLSEP